MDRAHPKHVQAAAFFRYFAQENYQLYSTILSVDEAYTTVYNTISPSLARDFLRVMALSSVNIVYPEAADMKIAVRTLESSNSVELTFTKAFMSVMCNKKSIPQIMTFDYFHALFGLQVFYLPM